MAEQYAEEPDPPASLEFLEAVETIMDDQHLRMPNTVQEALNFNFVQNSYHNN